MSAYTGVGILRGSSSGHDLPARKLIVKAVPAEPTAIGTAPSERGRVQAILVAAGLSLPAPSSPIAGQLSPEQREELARRVSGGTPLSQIIIEERRGR